MTRLHPLLLRIILELPAILAVYLASSPGSRSPAASQPDEDLVALWRGGDRVAFEILIRRYQTLAYTVCVRNLRNVQSAEEVAQDVFVTLYRKLGEFRGDSSFKSWFYRVLVNHCRNHQKAGFRRQQHLHDSIDAPKSNREDAPTWGDLPDALGTPEDVLDQRQRQDLINQALEDLDEDGRMILLLRDGQDLPYEDIAQSLQLPVGTVKSRLHRARADLKRAVERRSLANR